MAREIGIPRTMISRILNKMRYHLYYINTSSKSYVVACTILLLGTIDDQSWFESISSITLCSLMSWCSKIIVNWIDIIIIIGRMLTHIGIDR